MQSRGARSLRGLAAGLWATTTAAVSHAAAGGALPAPSILLLAVMFATIVCIALAGVTISAVRLLMAVSISQLAYHLVFSALGSHALVSRGTAHDHSALGLPLSVINESHDHASAIMVLMHALAGGATYAAFLFGERTFWSITSTALVAIAALLRPFTTHITPIRFARTVAPASVELAGRQLESAFVFCHGLRGPPLSASVV
jgi:hypothetical protein